MKSKIFILSTLITIFLFSCRNKPVILKQEYINVQFVIHSVKTYKYSKVEGYFTYQGIDIWADNGNTGYYYKRYNLSKNQVIPMKICLTYIQTNYGYAVYTDDIDVSKYEIN